ncbi:MAG: hypothetical protein RR234_01180, partial [Christensenella sp.]
LAVLACPKGMAAQLATIPLNKISESNIGQGVTNLINDLTTWGMILCPSIGGLAAVLFVVKRGMADEQEGKMWNKRIILAIACGVGGLLVGGIIKIISSYF